MRLILLWILNAVALLAVAYLLPSIHVASLEKCQWEEIKPQVDHVIFPDGKQGCRIDKPNQ